MSKSAGKTSTEPETARKSAKPTKTEAIIKLLRSKQGASMAEMQKATAWQSHSIRGFLSGTLKKRMGLAVESRPDKNGIRRYRIAATADTPAGH